MFLSEAVESAGYTSAEEQDPTMSNLCVTLNYLIVRLQD